MSIGRGKGAQIVPRINVSFKQTSREMRLYTEVKGKEEQSEFIKDCIEFYLKSQEKKQ